MRSYWEGTSLRLFLLRGYCGVTFAARQRFTSIGPLGEAPGNDESDENGTRARLPPFAKNRSAAKGVRQKESP